jgi:hypothetical protein
MTAMNFVTPKAAAKQDLLFKKPATGSYEHSCLDRGALFKKYSPLLGSVLGN